MADGTVNFQAAPAREDAEALADKVMGQLKVDEAMIEIDASTNSRAEFSRNEMLHLQGASEILFDLQIAVGGKRVRIATHDLTEANLARLVEQAQDLAASRTITNDGTMLPAAVEPKMPEGMYFDATTSAADPEAHGAAILGIVTKSRDSGLTAAGSLLRQTGANLIRSTSGYGGFSRYSYAEFSMAARTASGTGSGWAWAGTEDVGKVDIDDVAARAMDIATRSENPVAVEPGRYTVILEPEAVAQITDETIKRYTAFLSAAAAETGGNVFSKPGGGTRMGEQMADPRVQFLYDPYDPLMPFSPIHRQAMMKRTNWLTDGELTSLAYDPGYARRNNLPVTPNPVRARLEFNDTPMTREEMIARTRRGILVTRFSGLGLVDRATLLLSGVTRDGTFLIENGKITKPIKNMRFLESPFFIFNKIEASGVPVRSNRVHVTPRLLVNDFEFTSLSDAI